MPVFQTRSRYDFREGEIEILLFPAAYYAILLGCARVNFARAERWIALSRDFVTFVVCGILRSLLSIFSDFIISFTSYGYHVSFFSSSCLACYWVRMWSYHVTFAAKKCQPREFDQPATTAPQRRQKDHYVKKSCLRGNKYMYKSWKDREGIKGTRILPRKKLILRYRNWHLFSFINFVKTFREIFWKKKKEELIKLRQFIKWTDS